MARCVAGDTPGRLLSCGRPVSSVQVRIEGAGEPGERTGSVSVRGPGVSPGYFSLGRTLVDRPLRRWHDTGDLGFVDDDGFLHLVGRRDDMIKSSGYKVFPSEVERCIRGCAGVSQCVVFSVPHKLIGTLLAVAVVSESAGVEQEVITQCTSRLGAASAPRAVLRLGNIPLTASGKPDRMALIDELRRLRPELMN